MRAPILLGFAVALTFMAGPVPAVGQSDAQAAQTLVQGPDYPTYQVASGVSGNLTSMGSDTLANLMTLWAEEFKRLYPSVNIQVQAPGSSAAPPALIEGTANLGPMSRVMKDNELRTFEERHGYKPTAIAIAIDALAVYVHKDNPIQGLTLAQVDGIFSSTRICGQPEPVDTWGQLGLGGGWANRSVQRFGRNSVSGTYGYFKTVALCKGDFLNTVNEQPGSASVVQAVSASLNSIGYSGIGYRTASVRAVPLATESGAEFVDANAQNALSGRYPLARFLFLYVNKPPNQELAPVTREFLRMVLSQTGQDIVAKDGYIPLPAAVVLREREKLQ